MARLLLIAVLCSLAVAGCGDDDGEAGGTEPPAATEPSDPPAEDARASLRFEVDMDDGEVRVLERSCPEDPGDDDVLCDRLLEEIVAAANVDRAQQVCTMIYGGPETARITGTIEGEEIDLELSRENGCRLAEWDAIMAPLGFPAAGATGQD